MSSTNCGPIFIGPQGTSYVNAGPSCGPNSAQPFPQPYHMSPPPPISLGAHLPTLAPSLAHVP